MKRTIVATAPLPLAAFRITQAVAKGSKGDRDRIANAMSASPEAVARDTAVLDWPETEVQPYPVLREATNGWSCFPDWAPSPGNDPQCYDGYGMEWLNAYYAGGKPTLDGLGVVYRLQGGSDPGLSDPYATEPGPGAEWTELGPHMVILPGDPLDPAAHGTHHHGGGLWSMWPGTPYEHHHVPVR